MKLPNLILSAIATAILLAACGGGGGSGDPVPETTPTPSPASTPAPGETPAPAPGETPAPAPAPEPPPGSTLTPRPRAPSPIVIAPACTPAPVTRTGGYSLVFKGCDAANMATYFDKTECVRENTTGLIWQGFSSDPSSYSYWELFQVTNFDNPAANQVYIAVSGSSRPPTVSEIENNLRYPSNSIGMRNYTNGRNLCGFNNWRVPTFDELRAVTVSGNTEWFPNTPAFAGFWSNRIEPNAYYGSGFYFGAGVFYDAYRKDIRMVRLVRN
jgi:Protein of unknown function (DUF1566)